MFTSLLTQASTVVQHCLKAQPGDEVIIVSDESLGPDMTAAFRAAVVLSGAKDHLITYEPFHRRPPEEHCLFAGASLVPQEQLKLPTTMQAAMEAADGILLLNSDVEIFFVPAFREVARRKRLVSFAYLTFEGALRMLPSSGEEVEEIRATVEAGGEALGSATRARITSPQGTDISFRIGQYPLSLHGGVVGFGWTPLLPAGQVVTIPDDSSANGRFVIDRTISAHDYKLLEEPITFHVEEGRVVKIEGGLEAERLKTWLERLDNPDMYHVTELAFGTNPRCRLSGVIPGCEDTHTRGTISLALGCDAHFQGSVSAPAHCDMTMRTATLELDGKPIVEEGRLLL